MNPTIETQKRLKKKYGITITANMSIVALNAAWNQAPQEIRDKYPAIGDALGVANVVVSAQEVARTLFVTAKETYKATQSAIELASIPAGQSQVVPLAAAVAAKEGEKILNDQVTQLPSTIISTLENLV